MLDEGIREGIRLRWLREVSRRSGSWWPSEDARRSMLILILMTLMNG